MSQSTNIAAYELWEACMNPSSYQGEQNKDMRAGGSLQLGILSPALSPPGQLGGGTAAHTCTVELMLPWVALSSWALTARLWEHDTVRCTAPRCQLRAWPGLKDTR